MKILHAIYDDLDNPWVGGGGATRTCELYSRIAEMGHRVVVVCGSYPGAPLRRVRYGVRYRHVGLGSSHAVSRLTYMVGAARLIMKLGYDIVIEDVSPYSPLFSSRMSRGVTAVASVQNLSGRHATQKYGLAGWGPLLLERPLLRTFSNFIAVSRGVADELAQIRPGANIRVIPNSAGAHFFANGSGSLETEIAGPYILSLGRIDIYQKGLDRLIEAFSKVAEQEPNVALVIAGGGSKHQEEALRALVEASPHRDRISLLGEVAPPRGAALMRGAIALAMPSRYEAWPITAIEAGAAGIAVVGSDIVGVRDAAPRFPQGHGVLVPEGDIEELAGALLSAARNKERAARIGEKGREWAAKFSWDALAKRQIDFYKELVAKGC